MVESSVSLEWCGAHHYGFLWGLSECPRLSTCRVWCVRRAYLCDSTSYFECAHLVNTHAPFEIRTISGGRVERAVPTARRSSSRANMQSGTLEEVPSLCCSLAQVLRQRACFKTTHARARSYTHKWHCLPGTRPQPGLVVLSNVCK